jgi:hypothetical protein
LDEYPCLGALLSEKSPTIKATSKQKRRKRKGNSEQQISGNGQISYNHIRNMIFE